MIKLLIVDDEITTRKGLKDCIPWKLIGIDEVMDAEDGQKALEISMSFRPDIVLTDVRMPRMNGIELARELKVRLPRCKVVFLSGYSDKEYLLSAIHLQAINYIEKPVDLWEVREVIGKTVRLCLEEQQKISQEKERLCLDLIKHKESAKASLEKLRLMDISFPEGEPCILSLIKLNLPEENEFHMTDGFKNTVYEVIGKSLSAVGYNYLCAFKDRDYVVLLTYGNACRNKTVFAQTLGSLAEELENILPHQKALSIGVGKCFDNPCRIHESYQTAFIALQKEFYLGYGHIHFFKDFQEKEFDFSKYDIKTFMEHIQNENKTQAVYFIRSSANELKQCANTLANNIRNFFFNILISFSHLAEERGIQLARPTNTEEFLWDIISKASTITEIESYLLEKIELYFKTLMEKENRNSIVFSLMSYIKEHYANMDLSIKTLSEYSYLTPNYLCLLFKKESGKTINQYITEVRIDKAKELLKNRKVKLYEISSCVGFSDANYFAKIFKKTEGVTPSEYREKYFA